MQIMIIIAIIIMLTLPTLVVMSYIPYLNLPYENHSEDYLVHNYCHIRVICYY